MDKDNSDLSESYLNFSTIKDILFSSSDNNAGDISECNTSKCNISPDRSLQALFFNDSSSSFNDFCNEPHHEQINLEVSI